MRLAIVLALVAACFDPPPLPGPAVESHVESKDIPGVKPPAVDVLFVVDNTTAMAPYQAKIASLPTALAREIDSLFGAMPDVRIAVTTNDGVLSQVLVEHAGWDGVFTDHIDDGELAALLDVGATNTGSSQPLAAMRNALESSPNFLRDNAALVVIIVSATDDASPPDNYAAWLKTQKIDPGRTFVTIIQSIPSPAFDAFQLGFTSIRTSIESDDVGPSLRILGLVQRWAGGGPCFESTFVDDDPATPGDQFDCEFSAWDQGRELATLPHCEGGDPPEGTCWEIGMSQDCPDSLAWSLRGRWSRFRPDLHIECVTAF